MNISFIDKTIVVTGAGSGFGKEICKRISKYCGCVVAISKIQSQLDQLKKECERPIRTIAVDLASWKCTRDAMKDVCSIDGLVNNAGIAIIKPFHELTEKDNDEQFNVNFKAAFNITQVLLPQMNNCCSIVNISSLASLRACHGHTVYSATKAALDSLTRSIALELAPKKIRANSINPTVVLTDMGKQIWGDPKKADPLKLRIPLKRFGEVYEVVDLTMFLLSDQSSFISGHCIPLEGGYCAW